MSIFFAQPYNISAVGFYFDTLEAYTEKSESLLDAFGNPVEEFEIQFIDMGRLGVVFRVWYQSSQFKPMV
ncbi:hypothetical protein [Undibacterium sp. RuTC16W]|uniref:hypothetical protein n=1 Tax=Undibacterium sp. RuTC16W TaxID=3413048 RepID=UPI003BF31CCC